MSAALSLGRVGSLRPRGSWGCREGTEPWKPLPTGSRHPLVVRALGRGWECPREGLSPWFLAQGPIPAAAIHFSIPAAGIYFFLQPRHSPGWAPLFRVGSPCSPRLLSTQGKG